MNTDLSSKERRLAFLRRMIWWMPVLAFVMVAAPIVVLRQGFFGSSALMDGVLWGLAAAIIVGGAVALAYFGYKMMLDRSSS
jgi:hypothetical protein